jgi:hypothetical protein
MASSNLPQARTRPSALAAAVALLLLATAPTSSVATAGVDDRYVSGGTVVLEVPLVPLVVDDGVLHCNKSSTAPSVGGGCVAFSPVFMDNPAVLVVDDAHGTDVAFQVCLDNDGNGLCTFEPGAPACADDIVFSHHDWGFFSNPLRVPSGFRPGCPGGAWNGYLVFLCEGVHAAGTGGTAHTHAVTTGSMSVVPGGMSSGDFCGAPEPQGKAYTVA